MGKYCSRCKCEQPVERQKNSYCNPCKQARKKEARIRSRIRLNLPEHGRGTGGRSPHCSDCHKLKEDNKQGYCNDCRSRRAKEWRLKTGRSKRINTGLCPCGEPRAENQPYFCAKCKAEDSRRFRASQRLPAKFILQQKRVRKEFALLKRLCRKITEEHIRRGVLKKFPCEVCGNLKAEAHHKDYTKPKDLRWLCRQHHLEHHRQLKKVIEANK